MDVACSILLAAMALMLSVAYVVRMSGPERAKNARVAKEGKSALVSQGAMETFYSVAQPVAATCVRAGISANAVTWASLVLGLSAGALLGLGHFGAGALVGALSAMCDALDGLVARQSRTACDSGEVLDASVDRYVEFAMLAGLAVRFRASAVWLGVALVAICGSFMVSYSTAKAEALRVTPPRGSMRRLERAVILVAGTGLAPLAPFFGLAGSLRDAPVEVALALIALLANASAIRRLSCIASSVRRARPEPSASREPPAAQATAPHGAVTR